MSDGDSDFVSKVQRICFGVVLIALPLILIAALYVLWPVYITSQDGKTTALANVPLFGASSALAIDYRLLLIVVITGALGSYVHTATSFATYVGNSQLHRTWLWWYILRPLIGSVLALMFYFVLRGGLLTVSSGSKDLNPYGLAAVAGMVGMFAKQATDKLRETFDNLFRTAPGKGDDQRADKLDSTAPVILALSPATLSVAAQALTIKISGLNFVSTSCAEINNAKRVTRFVSATELQSDLVQPDVAAAGTLQFVVRNSDNVGGASAPVPLTVQ
jgi:hypothetical protein